MRIVKIKYFSLIILIVLSLFLAGCGGDDDDDDFSFSEDCDCSPSPVLDEKGITLIFEKQDTEWPSKISVLLKAETIEGEPVDDLKTADFSIYEDGEFISQFESQRAIVPTPGDFTYYTLLLLDLSGSVLESNSLTDLKQAAKGFVEAIMPPPNSDTYGTMLMGVQWFDGAARLHSLVSFVKEKDRLISGIDSISKDISDDKSTNLYGAVVQGIKIMDDHVGNDSNVISVGSMVLFTDGKDRANRNSEIEAVTSIDNAEDGISVYTIGLGGEIDETVLKKLITKEDGFAYAEDYEDLVPRFKEIADEIKQEANSHYLLKYCSPKRKGQHELKILVSYGDKSCAMSTCFCADGFTGGCDLGQAE
ncbi:von Willebrand factor A-like domain-containing protein [Desulfonema limicola]|uniref:von Willebrand factor A-like domain-containing protein n=1 Tax=Desulfonema limicola TaxID=45656 RepID=A0A975B7K8_9BACT|nr:VWA domain-containing protein [Desulfonema limicola]QTA80030.1 von Willebrand factor A-like domain-containing protein [Desulfonema limicola]